MIISGAKPTIQSKLRYLKEIQKKLYWYIDDRLGFDWGSSTLIGVDFIGNDWGNTLSEIKEYECKPFNFTNASYKFNVKKISSLKKWIYLDNADIEEKINLTEYLNNVQNPDFKLYFTKLLKNGNNTISFQLMSNIFLANEGDLRTMLKVGDYVLISNTWNKKLKYLVKTVNETTFTLDTAVTPFNFNNLTGLSVKILKEAEIRKENYDTDYCVEKIKFVSQGVYQSTDYFKGMTSYIDNKGNMKIYNISKFTMDLIFNNQLNISESVFDIVTDVTDEKSIKTIINGIKLLSKYNLGVSRILVFEYFTDLGKKTILASEELFNQDYAIFPDSVISEINTSLLNNDLQSPLYERMINDSFFQDALMIDSDIVDYKIKLFNQFSFSLNGNGSTTCFCAPLEYLHSEDLSYFTNERRRNINGVEYACSDDYEIAKKYCLTSLLCSINYDYYKMEQSATHVTPLKLKKYYNTTDKKVYYCADGTNWLEDTITEFIFITNIKKWYKKVVKNGNTSWVESFAGEYFKRIFIFSELGGDTDLVPEYICHLARGRIVLDVNKYETEKLTVNVIL